MSKRSYKPHQRLVFNWEESLHTIYLLEPIDYVGVLGWVICICVHYWTHVLFIYLVYIYERAWK